MKPDCVPRLLATPERIARARDFLAAALRLDAMIALKYARLDQLRAQKERLSSLPGAAECQKEIAALESQVLAECGRYLDKQAQIGALIAHVPQDKCRTVLECRYLQGMPFFRIAMKMHYDERQIYRFHRTGLEHVAVQMALGEDKTEKKL